MNDLLISFFFLTTKCSADRIATVSRYLQGDRHYSKQWEQMLRLRPKALRLEMQVFKVPLDFQMCATRLVLWSGLFLSTSASSAVYFASVIQQTPEAPCDRWHWRGLFTNAHIFPGEISWSKMENRVEPYNKYQTSNSGVFPIKASPPLLFWAALPTP